VAYSPNGKLLAYCSSSCSFRLCEAATGKTIRDVTWNRGKEKEQIITLAFSADSHILALSGELAIRLWDVDSGRELRRFGGKEDPHESLAFTPDGKMLAAGPYFGSDEDSRNGRIQLWDVATGRKLRSLPAPWDVWSIAVSPDGKHLAAGTEGASAHIWDLASGRQEYELGDREGRGRCIAFSPDGRTLAVAGFERDLGALDGVVWLWDVATGRELRRLGGRQQDVRAVAFSPDGKLLATAGNDNLIRLFDPATGAERISMPGHCGLVDVVALSPDGLVAATGDREFLRIWDAVTGNELHRMTGGKGEGTRTAFFSGDGKRLITGHDSGMIDLWDVTMRRELAHPAMPEKASWRGRFLADGRVVAAGNTESRLYVWDVAARKAVAELPLMEREVYAVALCPDCRRVAYGAMGAEIRLWDLGRKKTRQFIEPAGMVFDRGVSYLDSVGELVFSEDGKSLLTRTHGKGVRLWEVSAGQERLQLKASLDDLWSLALSPDGLTIASGAWGGDVRLWDAVTGNELFSSFEQQ
jgi:WD40 repeat protein